LVTDCRRLLSERGEANSVAIARSLVTRYDALAESEKDSFFERLANDFGPQPLRVLACAQSYADQPSSSNLQALIRQVEPPRQELLRRINRLPGGTSNIVAMRQALLSRLGRTPKLQAVEADFLHLLSSWFNPGFLQLARVDWNSPAQLLEKLIRHEAVHEIDGWDDLRRRLQPDRRCFAFFHPQLPQEPLIFVEVALLTHLPAAIGPLIDKKSTPTPQAAFKVAAFYSISNCQPGLRGVSLGNFLIKRVAVELQRELPPLQTFCTLSPIPGLARWIRTGAKCAGLGKAREDRLRAAHQTLLDECGADLDALSNAPALRAMSDAAAQALRCLGASFLVDQSPTSGGDPVARFHLDNGARLEQLHARADLSPKGIRQSFGLMVNYLYDLKKVEANHEKFTHSVVAHSRSIASLL
jgi:malonyl-CoA decarboxylase